MGSASYLSGRKYCIGAWDATEYNPATQNNAGSGCLRWINGRNEINGADIGRYSGSPAEVHDDGRFWSALGTTAWFTAVAVTVELMLGLGVALLLHRGGGLFRAAILLPWD